MITMIIPLLNNIIFAKEGRNILLVLYYNFPFSVNLKRTYLYLIG